MEESRPDPHHAPEPSKPEGFTAPDSGVAPAPAVRGSRRPWLIALLGLYAASVLAALILLARGGGGDSREGSRAFLRSPGRLLLSAKSDAVGWVSIHGPIYHSGSGSMLERGAERWGRRIRSLAERSDVKAIVLDIDSPGGSVGAVQELYETIRRVRSEKKKPIVALIGDVAASGGYYLAVGCDKVIAHPGSLVGSIGVIFSALNVQELFAKIGIKSDPIKSGRLKDIGSPTRPMTKEERDLLQGIIDDTYGQFLSAVALGRSLPESEVRPLADGRILNGRQALSHKLVDSLGDSQNAVELAGKLGGIAGKPKVVREADSLESVLGLLDSVMERVRPEAALLRELKAFSRAGLEYRWTGFR